MGTKYESMLNEEIVSQLEEVGKNPLGEEKSKIAIDGVTKLIDRSIELKKMEIDRMEQEAKRESECILKQMEIEKEHKTRMIDLVIKGTLGVAGLGLTVWGTLYTTNFERDDNYTTSAAKNFVSSLFKPKKI